MRIRRWHEIDIEFTESERTAMETYVKRLQCYGWEINQEEPNRDPRYENIIQLHRIDLHYNVGESGEPRRALTREEISATHEFLKRMRGDK